MLIFSFLVVCIGLVIFLVSRVYSLAEITINETTIEVKFLSSGNLVMRDFSFLISDLKSAVTRPVGISKFLDVTLRFPHLRFQIGPARNKLGDFLAFESLAAKLCDITSK